MQKLAKNCYNISMDTKLENEKSYPEVYYAKHMKEGVANYPEHKEVIYIKNDTIAEMAKGFVGKPVFVHHQDIDMEHLKDQMDGVVSESFWNKYDGNWWVKFIAITDEAKRAISNGWGVSNCYDNLVRGTGGTCINVKYDSEIIGGKFNHLAIVENPRYEDAKIYTEEEYNIYNESKKQKLERITNSKGENMDKIVNQADVKDLLLSKDSEITVGEAIEKFLNSKRFIDKEAEILLDNGEKVTVAELMNACKNEDDEEKAENEAEEKEEEKAENEAEKEEEKKEENEAEEKKEENEAEEEEKNECKKNSSVLKNAYKTACLNNAKSEYEKEADGVCDSIFNGIERAKNLGI